MADKGGRAGEPEDEEAGPRSWRCEAGMPQQVPRPMRMKHGKEPTNRAEPSSESHRQARQQRKGQTQRQKEQREELEGAIVG